jgi:glutamate racemase
VIGVFDSGVGGLSVLRHLRELLPTEPVLYAADAAWCPYGPRPAAVVRRRVSAIVDELVARGVRELVVACNTASTVALAGLRKRYPTLPIVGMEPALKPAAASTTTGAVGVLATATTARGEALARLVDRFGRGVAVHVAVPEGLVELVEAGLGESAAAEAILAPIAEEWRRHRVDVVVLGCTHYPFAQRLIERLVGSGVEVIDPAPAVARQAARVLGEPTPNGRGDTTFLTTGDPEALRATAGRLVEARWVREGEYARLVR